MLRFIIKFVVIDYWWWIRLLLLLLLEPAKAKEEYVGSYSIVLTDSIGLAKGTVRYYKLEMITENAHKSLVQEEHRRLGEHFVSTGVPCAFPSCQMTTGCH
jgi:general stress protein CsbA